MVATDPGLEQFLTGDGPPALRAAHLLAGLSLVAGEQPSIARGVAIANPDRWDADATFVERGARRTAREPAPAPHDGRRTARRGPDRDRRRRARRRARVPAARALRAAERARDRRRSTSRARRAATRSPTWSDPTTRAPFAPTARWRPSVSADWADPAGRARGARPAHVDRDLGQRVPRPDPGAAAEHHHDHVEQGGDPHRLPEHQRPTGDRPRQARERPSPVPRRRRARRGAAGPAQHDGAGRGRDAWVGHVAGAR